MTLDMIGNVIGAVGQVVGAASAIAALFPSQSRLTGILLSVRKVIDMIGFNFGNAKNAH